MGRDPGNRPVEMWGGGGEGRAWQVFSVEAMVACVDCGAWRAWSSGMEVARGGRTPSHPSDVLLCAGGAHENMRAWLPEEDHIILDMVASEGPKWTKIVGRLPGRSVSSVRNRWQRIEKGRKMREAGKEFKNRCHSCGQLKRGHVCIAKLQGGPQVPYSASAPVRPTFGGPTPTPQPATMLAAPPPIRHTRSSDRLRAPMEPNIVVDRSQLKLPPEMPAGLGQSVPLAARNNSELFELGQWEMPPAEAYERLVDRTTDPMALPPVLQRYASGEGQVHSWPLRTSAHGTYAPPPLQYSARGLVPPYVAPAHTSFLSLPQFSSPTHDDSFVQQAPRITRGITSFLNTLEFPVSESTAVQPPVTKSPSLVSIMDSFIERANSSPRRDLCAFCLPALLHATIFQSHSLTLDPPCSTGPT